MKLITWNVNGLRACMGKGMENFLTTAKADIVAIQETKMNTPEIDFLSAGYMADWNCGERLGYSGTVCLYKNKPLSVTNGFGNERLDSEGRMITLEYPSFNFVNAYVPNSQGGLDRWYYRLDWDSAFQEYLDDLQRQKPIIVCGDFNVARDYIDVYPENLRNDKNPPGFLSEERDGFNALLDLGLSDVFRELHPTRERAYSWWSNRLKKRDENRGWRIDYFLISDSLMPRVKSCEIRADIFGSDHAPVELDISL